MSLKDDAAALKTNLDELALEVRVLHIGRREEDEHERHELVVRAVD